MENQEERERRRAEVRSFGAPERPRLNSLRRVGGDVSGFDPDSVRRSFALYRDDRGRGMKLLMEAERYWMNMDEFRRERERCKKYAYGKQWDDVIEVNGCRVSEEEYIKSQGNVPLKNNLIGRLVRNVVGIYSSQAKEPTCIARDRDEQRISEVMTTALQYNWQLNDLNEIHRRTMEEFLIGGLIVHKKTAGWRNGHNDCWTDIVAPDDFFCDNHWRDPRGWDMEMCGEIHDVGFDELCHQFASNPGDASRLAAIYAEARTRDGLAEAWRAFGMTEDRRTLDFYIPRDRSQCRLIEIWRKEAKEVIRCHDPNTGELYVVDASEAGEIEAKNEERRRLGFESGMEEDEIPLIRTEWMVNRYWRVYFLSPQGDIIMEADTPYEHGEHPYVVKGYPFIDGEIHSFVSNIIDQQRYVNRLIIMYDWIMRASSKGVLLFPEEALPDGMTIDEVADEWTRFNGVIMIKSKPGMQLPQQVANNSTNIGISEMLNIQLKLFEDISGVNGALQGKPGYSGMSAALYNQQAQNATTSLVDILESYSHFTVTGAYKDVKNIQQFYDQSLLIRLTNDAEAVEYHPSEIRDVEFDLAVVESTQTPVFRAVANDFLMEIWKSGQISLETMLENSSFPFADRLLQSVQAQKESMAAQQEQQGMDPALMQQARQGVDMNAVGVAQNMLKFNHNQNGNQ